MSWHPLRQAAEARDELLGGGVPEGRQPLPLEAEVPRGWRLVDVAADGYAAVHRASGLRCIVTRARERDGQVWLHLSAAMPNREPTWAEMVSARDALLGEEQPAYHVVPPRSRYVNLHPNVLHLWAPEGHEPLPEFSEVTADGRRTV